VHVTNLSSIFWVPLLLSVAFLIFSLALPELGIGVPYWLRIVSIVLAVGLLACAGYAAYRAAGVGRSRENPIGNGGSGGAARVLGDQSSAHGGEGGRGGLGSGG
jgi:hypothetical protein